MNEPAEHDLERQLAGGALLDERVMVHALPIEALHNEQHRRVYESASAIRGRGEPVTPQSLDAELSARGWYRGPGTFGRYACHLGDPRPIVVRLRELHQLREVMRRAQEVVLRCADRQAHTEVRRAVEELHEVAAGGVGGVPISTYTEVLVAGIERLQEIAKNEFRAETIVSGIPDLDAHVGGWMRGDLMVIGGDPSAGKSTTMLLAALSQSESGHHPGIVSIEDSRERWFRRIASTCAGVPISSIKAGRLRHDEWRQMQELISIGGRKIDFAWALGAALDEVVGAVRALIARGCDVIYVDYLQAIDGGSSEQAFRFFIKRALTAMRREANQPGREVPIVLGSQFKKRADETQEPKNSDLYEAAYIHQKADSIVLLWRDHPRWRRWVLSKAKDDDTGIAESTGVLWRDGHGLLVALDKAAQLGLVNNRERDMESVGEEHGRRTKPVAPDFQNYDNQEFADG